jgi:hypothetical protein
MVGVVSFMCRILPVPLQRDSSLSPLLTERSCGRSGSNRCLTRKKSCPVWSLVFKNCVLHGFHCQPAHWKILKPAYLGGDCFIFRCGLQSTYPNGLEQYSESAFAYIPFRDPNSINSWLAPIPSQTAKDAPRL